MLRTENPLKIRGPNTIFTKSPISRNFDFGALLPLTDKKNRVFYGDHKQKRRLAAKALKLLLLVIPLSVTFSGNLQNGPNANKTSK